MTTTATATVHPNRNSSTPAGYDSIVLAADFHTEGITAGSTGSHYNYQLQAWRDGNDHVHVDADCLLAPLFCGADVTTCQGE